MRWNGIYELDRGKQRVCMLPMAARRALDATGIHVSLAAWRNISAEDQKRFVALGSAYRVSVARVAALVCKLGIAYRLIDPVPEPARRQIPSEVSNVIGPQLTPDAWASFLPLDRYTLLKLAAGREGRALVAFGEIMRRREAAACV